MLRLFQMKGQELNISLFHFLMINMPLSKSKEKEKYEAMNITMPPSKQKEYYEAIKKGTKEAISDFLDQQEREFVNWEDSHQMIYQAFYRAVYDVIKEKVKDLQFDDEFKRAIANGLETVINKDKIILK